MIKKAGKGSLKKIVNLVLIGLTVLLVVSFTKNFLRIRKATQRISEKEKDIENTRQENNKAAQKLSQMQNPYYMEKQLRDELGLAKEGEIVVVLPDEDVLKKIAPKRFEEDVT